jgi:hypothetical protein
MDLHNSLCDIKHKKLSDNGTYKESHAADDMIKASCGYP